MDGDLTGRLSGLAGAVFEAVQPCQIKLCSDLGRVCLIIQSTASGQHRHANGPVEQARIQIGQAIEGSKARGYRALTRRGRSVNGDDQRLAHARISAPSSAIRLWKVGKLVAIISGSSTVTEV